MNATRGEEKQMGSSMTQEEKARSPPMKRSSGEFGEELAKRQRRLEVEEKQTEGKEEEAQQEREEAEEGKESPEKRLKLSEVGERLAALANQSLAHVTVSNNQSLAQAPILNNQSLAQVTISNKQSFPPVPTFSLQVGEESKVEDQGQQEIGAEGEKGRERETLGEVMVPVNKEVISADAITVGEGKTAKESSCGETVSVQSKEAVCEEAEHS